MRFLVTGITGFVGPHLKKLLEEEGHDVFGLTSETHLSDPRFKYFNIDIRRDVAVHGLFYHNKFDGVFHLASLTHPPTSFEEPLNYFNVNAVGTANICEAIRLNQPECVFMYCSTSEVYGVNPGDTVITEGIAVKPNNPYAVSKAAGEMFCKERMENGFLKGFITRAFSHTGPGRPKNYSISSDAYQIARIIKNKQAPVVKVGNLNSKRTVMDVRDVVCSYYLLMKKSIAGKIPSGEIYNICGDSLNSMSFFLNRMLEIYDLDSYIDKEVDSKLFRKIDIPVQNPDCSKLKRCIDWQPKIHIDTTLRDLVEWWIERV